MNTSEILPNMDDFTFVSIFSYAENNISQWN